MSDADNGSALEAHHAAEHADDGGGHGHGHDPNEGVVVGTPPTPAWVLTAAVIGLVTALATVLLGIALRDVSGSPTETEDHGLRPVVMTVVG